MIPDSFPPLKDLAGIAAENNPTEEAFGDGATGHSLTWQEFDDESTRAALALSEHVSQGDRVAFLCEASVDHVVMWYGAIKAGCIPSNLHARASPATVRYCVNQLHPDVLVVDEEFSEFAEEHVYDDVATDFAAVVTLGQPSAPYEASLDAFLNAPDVTDGDLTPPDVRVREDDIATVIWTSGTTGHPKGWSLTNRAAVVRGMKFAGAFNIGRTTRRIQPLSPSFTAWFTGTMPALMTHSTMYFLRDWDPEQYLSVIQDQKITMANLVPTMWRELIARDDFEDYNISSLNRVTAAGERLDTTTLNQLQEHVCDLVYNAYAATEAGVAAHPSDEMTEERVESVGKPMMATAVRIVEEGGDPTEPLPPGEVGEIIVRAPDSVAWVWGDTETTKAAFEDGWWFSGDLGYKDEDGYLYLEGRKDFMILSKGIKVYPVPIEERLNAHPGVKESAVIGVEDEEYGEMVTATVRRSDLDVGADELDEWCLEDDELARYERPREYRFVEDPLPKTATNKLDRDAAREFADE